MAYVLTLIYAFLLFCMMIIIHEFGHFISARILGVKVNEFSMGMGPAIWKKQKGETLYAVRLFPVGGYCALEGEDEDGDGKDTDPRSFVNQSYPNKILILMAGSFMNLVFCVTIMIIVYMCLKVGPLRAVNLALGTTGMVITSIFSGLKMLLSGAATGDDVMGIVGIAGVVSEQAKLGALDVSYLMAILSANLAVMNMLPIPALDGGRILLTVIRWITGGRLSGKAEAIINAVGMVLLVVLMIVLVVKDTIRFF
ncbi:MAG: site-2 protease family protein [Firmicutes bacterium]|nr:site-2 protease family protein [Bacillota bacterium]MBQ2455904.1 site-2 protease family protein [Bacillota bacterium]MBQ4181054.1 site-2 protease family protein [Bacillota bacterium]